MKLSSICKRTLGTAIVTAYMLSGCSEHNESNGSNKRFLISAQSYHAQHQYRASLLEVRNALKQAPSNEAAELYARIFVEIGQPKTAAEFIETYGAKSFELSELLVRAYLDQGKYISADRTLQNFNAEALPGHKYQTLQAEVLAGQGDYDKANQLIAEVLTKEPNNLEALLLKLQIASIEANALSAQEAIDALEQHHSTSPKALVVLARAATARKDFAKAESLLMESLRYVPDSDIMTPARASTLLLLIETLTNQGRYADAAPYSNALANSNPNWQETQDRMENAIASLQAGDLKAAEKILLQIQEDNPNQSRSAALLGVINLQKGNAQKANEYFADHIDPETAAPIFTGAAALAQLRQNQVESALQMLETALEANPDNQRLLVLYGLTATRLPEEASKGIEALKKALAETPTDSRIHTALADGYFNAGQNALGIKTLYSALEQDDNTVGLRYHVAKRLLSQGLSDEAVKFADKLIKQDKKSEHNWIISGLVSANDKDIPKSIDAFEQAIKLNPKSYTANLYLALTSANQQNWEKAVAGFKNAIAEKPEQVAPYGGLIKSLDAQNAINSQSDIEKTTNQFKKHTKSKGDAINSALILADYLIQKNELQKAQKAFDTLDLVALKETQGQIRLVAEETYVNLIKLHVRDAVQSNAYDKANTILNKAIDEFPQNIKLLSFKAAYHLQQDQLADAAAIASQLRQLDERVFPALISADILMKQNNHEQALSLLLEEWDKGPHIDLAQAINKTAAKADIPLKEEFLDSWTQAFPNQVQPHFYRANTAQAAGDIKTAISHYEKIISIDEDNVGALNNAAWFYFELGSLEKADHYATIAAQYAPSNAAVLDTAGWIKYNLNQPESVALLKQAAELAPDNTEINEHYRIAKLHFNK